MVKAVEAETGPAAGGSAAEQSALTLSNSMGPAAATAAADGSNGEEGLRVFLEEEMEISEKLQALVSAGIKDRASLFAMPPGELEEKLKSLGLKKPEVRRVVKAVEAETGPAAGGSAAEQSALTLSDSTGPAAATAAADGSNPGLNISQEGVSGTTLSGSTAS